MHSSAIRLRWALPLLPAVLGLLGVLCLEEHLCINSGVTALPRLGGDEARKIFLLLCLFFLIVSLLTLGSYQDTTVTLLLA